MLFTPEELGWISGFTKELQEKVPQKQWTALLHHLVQLGVALPAACTCTDAWELESWLHKNHVEYNTQIRAAIMASPGAREGLYKALNRDVQERNGGDKEFGKIARRDYGKQLLDFLLVSPTLGWFKAPVPEGRMYQGTALDDQERNPGLSN
jgi:hypothetical protein